MWCHAVLVLAMFATAAYPGAARARMRSGRARTASWSWSAPRPVDRQTPFGAIVPLSAGSCPDPSLCVAVGDGVVTWSGDPAAGAGSWRAAVIDPRSWMVGVSCVSAHMCAAVDAAGRLEISDRPTAGRTAWRGFQIAPVYATPVGISCPSPSLCVVADTDGGSGGVLTSRHPAIAASWNAADLPERMVNVSCATVSLCVALGEAGDMFVSAAPTDGTRAWRPSSLGLGPHPDEVPVGGVACPSTSLCVLAVGSEVLATNQPTAGARSLHVVAHLDSPSPGAWFTGITCHTTAFCVGFTSDGGDMVSADPGGAGAWQPGDLHTGPEPPLTDPAAAELGPLTGACSSEVQCVAFDGPRLWTSDAAQAGGGPWVSAPTATGYDAVTGLLCPQQRLCVGFDDAGNVLFSHDPAVGVSSWSSTHVDDSPLTQLVCPAPARCVGVDAAGALVTSGDPAGGSAAWSTVTPPEPALAGGLQCPSTTLCVALARATGDVLVSDVAGFPAGSWTVAHVDSSSLPCGGNHPIPPQNCAGALTSLSCPSPSLCVAVDSNGDAVATAEPAGGASSWHSQVIDPASDPGQEYDPIEHVSCSSARLCVAVDSYGSAFISSDPLDLTEWSQRPLAMLNELTCRSRSLCLGMGGGQVFVTAHPADPAVAWRSSGPPDGDGILSCLSDRFCAATTGVGVVATSTDPSAVARAWPARTVDPASITALACASPAVCIAADAYGRMATGRRVFRRANRR